MKIFNLNGIEVMATHGYDLRLGSPAFFPGAHAQVLQEAIEYSNDAMYGDMYEGPEDYGYNSNSNSNNDSHDNS